MNPGHIERNTNQGITKRQMGSEGSSEILWEKTQGKASDKVLGKAGDSSYLLHTHSNVENIISILQWSEQRYGELG